MANINFDNGLKTFEINNDPNRTITFNPNDLNLVKRLMEAEKNIKGMIKEAQNNRTQRANGIDIEAFNKLVDVEKECRKQFDYIFGEDGYADIVFGNQSLFSVSKGKTIVENFISGLINVVSPMMSAEQEKFNKNVNKYKSQYDRKPTNSVNH